MNTCDQHDRFQSTYMRATKHTIRAYNLAKAKQCDKIGRIYYHKQSGGQSLLFETTVCPFRIIYENELTYDNRLSFSGRTPSLRSSKSYSLRLPLYHLPMPMPGSNTHPVAL